MEWRNELNKITWKIMTNSCRLFNSQTFYLHENRGSNNRVMNVFAENTAQMKKCIIFFLINLAIFTNLKILLEIVK